MSGFDPAKLNAEFFPDGKWKANFLCNLGYGDPYKALPPQPPPVLRRGLHGAVVFMWNSFYVELLLHDK